MDKTRLKHWCDLDVLQNQPHKPPRNTGIICTIGPASQSVDMLEKLIEAGMCIVRMNCSHGDHDYHKKTIQNTHEACDRLRYKNIASACVDRLSDRLFDSDMNIAIALDTKGPEIRTGTLKREEFELITNRTLILSTDEKYCKCGDDAIIYVDYKNITKVLKIGDIVYIDDGLISVKIIGKTDTSLTTIVQNGGKLGSCKGVNLPGTKVDLPALSTKDREDLKFGVEQGVDMVFASFIRKAQDVCEVREQLGEKGKHIRIISKIENQEGIDNFDEILEVSDGIMVARGDLGIEIAPEKVFLAQKMMIGCCNKARKPVIVATQMLESMVDKPRPTRAETSDVANAVLDGADCVMLSGETAKGKYPVEAVEMMHKICCEAEAAMFHRIIFDELRLLSQKSTETLKTLAIAAVDAAFDQSAAAIICLTTIRRSSVCECGQWQFSNRTASVLAYYRPPCPVIAVTRDRTAARMCHLHRGVHPLYYTDPPKECVDDTEERFLHAIKWGKEMGFIQRGSAIIKVNVENPDPANMIRIFHVNKN